VLGVPDAVQPDRGRPRRGVLAAEGLAVEALFAAWGVVPEEVDPAADPVVALELAIRELDAVRPTVPLGLWAAMHALRTRAER